MKVLHTGLIYDFIDNNEIDKKLNVILKFDKEVSTGPV